MDKQEIISKTAHYVQEKLANEKTGHDWWHVYRVWQNAKRIGTHENVDMFVVELAALLHDIADWKFHDGDSTVGPKVAREWLEKLAVDRPTIDHVCSIVEHISYMGANTKNNISTNEGKVVQDADRLDALGAIGIGRTFIYGGVKGRDMYNPDVPPQLHASAEEYKANTSPTINHFYEKLLLLKERMNTKTGKELALERHEYMERFVKKLLAEWEGSE